MCTLGPMPLLRPLQSATKFHWNCERVAKKKNAYVAKMCLLQSTFDDSRRGFGIGCDQSTAYDRRAYRLCRIDNLFDAGNTQSDVHGGDSGKMERFQGHLGPGLTDRLGTDSADSRAFIHTTLKSRPHLSRNAERTRLYLCFRVLCPTDVQERKKLVLCDLGFVVNDSMVSLWTRGRSKVSTSTYMRELTRSA